MSVERQVGFPNALNIILEIFLGFLHKTENKNRYIGYVTIFILHIEILRLKIFDGFASPTNSICLKL